MANDYPLVGAPSITLGQFQAVLTAAHSPAAGEAPAMYAAIRRYNVDPAVVLAIMQHESSFGKLGIAVGRNNGFGSRYYSGTSSFGATNRGGWAAFPNWAAGAGYTASLLASSSYAGSKNAGTARTFANRYAPSSDGNNPSAYGVAVVNAINGWKGIAPIKAGTTKPVAKAKVAAKTTAARAAAPVTAHGPSMITIAGVGLLLILLLFLVMRL